MGSEMLLVSGGSYKGWSGRHPKQSLRVAAFLLAAIKYKGGSYV
jgi:hypothetical protein